MTKNPMTKNEWVKKLTNTNLYLTGILEDEFDRQKLTEMEILGFFTESFLTQVERVISSTHYPQEEKRALLKSLSNILNTCIEEVKDQLKQLEKDE